MECRLDDEVEASKGQLLRLGLSYTSWSELQGKNYSVTLMNSKCICEMFLVDFAFFKSKFKISNIFEKNMLKV